MQSGRPPSRFHTNGTFRTGRGYLKISSIRPSLLVDDIGRGHTGETASTSRNSGNLETDDHLSLVRGWALSHTIEEVWGDMGAGAINDRSVLLIEDDPEVIRALSMLVQGEIGCDFTFCTDGAEGLAKAMREDFALVIIDANLPSKPGFEICRELRAGKPAQAILFLTGRCEEIDKVLGLELGADDYVTKPFSPRELAARIKALLRRAVRSGILSEGLPTIEIGRVKIDTVSHRVWLEGELVELTHVEYELLTLLASNPGRAFTRSELLELVLGYSTGSHDHALTVHFSRIRSKIEKDPNNPVYLKTVRGVGYRFAAPDEVE